MTKTGEHYCITLQTCKVPFLGISDSDTLSDFVLAVNAAIGQCNRWKFLEEMHRLQEQGLEETQYKELDIRHVTTN